MSIVDPIVGKTTEVACGIVFHHIGYLFQYDKNIRNLEAEIDGLGDIRRRIDEKVERAQKNAEIIEPDVEKWKEAAKEMQDDVAKFMLDKVRSNTRCVYCWCPNPMWRYHLGRKSKLKTSSVVSLKEQGTKYLTELPLSHPAPPLEHPLTSHEAFDSRQEILNGIMEALKDPTIKMIGVHGAGGVGKTTMVKEVRKLAKKNGIFDDVAFAVVSRNLDKKTVQGELAAQLGLHLDDYGRADKLQTRLLNGKKNLVILDDLWDPLDLEDIGIPTTTDHGNKEGYCKVMVTSRKQLLRMMMPKPVDQRAPKVASSKQFHIPILEKKEAWLLFTKTADTSFNSNEEILSTAKKVCDECGGLPVAILAVAKALQGKELYEWQNALELLKNSNFDQIVDIEPNLFSSLKLSYDCLEPRDARPCFLLCSLFPEDAQISIEDLVLYSFGMRLLDRITTLENVRIRVLALVKSLKASCLLLDGMDDNTVKMHDVIRDVAILIAKDEKGYLVNHDLKKWPEGGTFEGYSVISLKSEYFTEIPSELGSQEFHTLVWRSKDSSLPDSFFKGMETNLEVLDLSGTAIKSLPFSLSKLVKLRMLLLPYEVTDISLLGELKSLEILSVNGIEKLTPEIRQLTSLKFLDLASKQLPRGPLNRHLGVISPNVISNLKRLEGLCIPDDFNGWEDEATETERKNATDTEGNASLVEVNSLTNCLTSLKVHIPRGKSSPNNLCFENLVRFRISIGEPFKKEEGEEEEKEIPFTKTLKIYDVPLEDKFKVLLVKSEVVYITEVKALENLFHGGDGSGFSNLKILKVKRCDGGENLLGRPEPSLQTPGRKMPGPFCNLTELFVKCCSFKYLFSLSVTRRLQQLQKLEVIDCDKLEAIVGNESQGGDEEILFPRLRKMKLAQLPNLTSFSPSKRPTSITEASNSDPAQPLFCEKVVVPALEELTIWGLDNISEVWETLLGRQETSQQTPQQEMPRSFCNLTELCVDRCSFKYLFSISVARRLEHLQKIEASSCDKMEVIIGNERHGDEEEIVFPRLREMILKDLPNLISFSRSKRPNSITEASNSDPAQPLFCEKVVVPALEKLSIRGLKNISEVWDKQFKPIMTEGIGSFSQLRSFHVAKCPRLVNAVPSNMLQRLRNLESLKVADCESVVREIENLTMDLPQLRRLDLQDLPNLKETGLNKKEDSLHGINVVYPNITHIHIVNCPNLESVFPASTARKLTHLEYLSIKSGSSGSKLKAIVETLEERDGANDDELFVFPELGYMRLVGMGNLQSFCSSCGHEESFFNQKVVFPCLRLLSIVGLGNVKGIWNRTPPADSFQKLIELRLEECHDLLYVAPSELLIGCLQNLVWLNIINCKLLEEVFKGRGSDSGEGIVSTHDEPTTEEVDTNNVVLPRLRNVWLRQLPRLKRFCSGNNKLPSSVRTRFITDCPLLLRE